METKTGLIKIQTKNFFNRKNPSNKTLVEVPGVIRQTSMTTE